MITNRTHSRHWPGQDALTHKSQVQNERGLH